MAKENEVAEALKLLEDALPDYPILLGYNDCIFYIDGSEIIYNTDNNKEDLFNGDGNTYGGYLPEGFSSNDKYLVANVDTQTGCWVTEIFNIGKMLELED